MVNQNWVANFLGPFPDIMYVFSDIPPEKIIDISHTYGGFPHRISDIEELFHQDAETPEEFMLNTMTYHFFDNYKNYKEIAIERENVKPTAILCFDKVNDDSIKHAEHYGI